MGLVRKAIPKNGQGELMTAAMVDGVYFFDLLNRTGYNLVGRM